jgi:hypothetical protein
VKRVDQNHVEIVKGLRAIGASVQSIASVGKGCPDLLVGMRGFNWILEVKDGSRPPSQRRLTDDEKKWHDSWRGDVRIVTCLDEALDVIGVR